MSGVVVLVLRLLLAAALYAFLGWSVYTMWRELQSQARSVTTRIVPRLSLTVRVKGAEPLRRTFQSEEVHVGRDPACDVHITEDTVSVRHARLRYHHNQWWVEDLGSKNGTRLNKHNVSSPTVLATGDEISCGKTKLMVEIDVEDVGLPTQKLR